MFNFRCLSALLLTGLLWLGIQPSKVWATEGSSIQPYLDQVADAVTEFTLDNGLKFIVLEQHQAPVISFMTYCNIGAADEPDGQTGVAHFLEHLAFKGTQSIGTRNYREEQVALDHLDRLFDQIQSTQAGGEEVSVLQAEFEQWQQKAASYVEQNELGQIIEQSGGVGLNATTSTDATRYFYSLPSNKLELWMSLESDRFLHPVFREFYEEKQVILEERRMRVENDPVGELFEAVQDKAFQVHPYKRPVIGYSTDIENLTRQNVRDFFERYYTPKNITIAIVGDVNPAEVQELAALYFGRFAPGSLSLPQLPQEPPQTESKTVTLVRKTQPWTVSAYHIPGITDPDYVLYEMLGNLLSNGRTSRLYQNLVEQRLAIVSRGFTGYPNDKYPNLMAFYTLPAPGHSLAEVEAAVNQELENLKTTPVSDRELQRVKNQIRADLLRSLQSTRGLAAQLAEYEVKTGSWQNLLTQLDRIQAVTPMDIQRIAQQTFRPENLTLGRLQSDEQDEL
ncbi:MAG: M16 family metallopeptidase [Prochlorotrichaceae cyanobacterium]|jgi:predicted Zn-dependent peptidase